ncbi:MAG: UDP-N-acetylmuramate--L-alanine ligase [Methanobacterium sp. PtaB.Bin024]|nr:MAG: UDP-N-acetylmuramate--L-alanine ligase [Methanobacterium sp. PtaB.Bin024]
MVFSREIKENEDMVINKMSANMDKHSSKLKEVLLSRKKTYGVIGICGVVGNLVARVLMDHQHNVICTDLQNSDNCPFLYTLAEYNPPIYLSDHPESFFTSSDYIIPPPSLSKTSKLFKKIIKSNSQLMEVDDIIEQINPDKPVICITGTNGKTTTTTLLKHFCYRAGLKPTEHGFKTLQGNVAYIPPLQCRLNGDIAVLETGTEGEKGDLKFSLERCQPSCGVITNITPDHLNNGSNFMQYARIKGELLEELQGKTVVLNSDDPTIWGLLSELNYQGKVVTFGVEHTPQGVSKKICWCKREILIEETLSGVGYYECQCGLKRPIPHYLAKNITENSFLLQTPQEIIEMEMGISGLHNVYNALGAIATAHELLNIPLEDIKKYLKTFKGVPGRLECIYHSENLNLIVDYAHNPSGVETVLRELKKTYDKLSVVITISSESGRTGDEEIMKKTMANADFIIPASYYSRQAAGKYISSGKIKLTDKEPDKFRSGTLGATQEQVLEGLKKGLECNTDTVVCLGEAAVKFKDNIKLLIDLNMEKIGEK